MAGHALPVGRAELCQLCDEPKRARDDPYVPTTHRGVIEKIKRA
jgi:hypothetical protein